MEGIRRVSYKKTLTMLTIVFFFVLGIAVSVGAADIPLDEVFQGIYGDEPGQRALIIREIRFPRVVAAAVIGSALGIAGAIIQGVTRNPLADPGLIGITAGASFALSVAYAFSDALPFLALSAVSFLGALFGIVLVIGLALFSRERLSIFSLLLVGASVSLFLHALTQGVGLYFGVSKNVNMWTSGGLGGITWNHLWVAGPIVVLCSLLAVYHARQITLLSLDEDLAVALGQHVLRTKIILMVVIAVLTGIAVAIAGNLAFVGLMIPHLVRRLVGHDYRRIIPASILVGGIFMMGADVIARMMNRPYEVPLAAVVSVIGLPFFLVIVGRMKGGMNG
ncbi:MAG: FecCD family ABC transporter permease [Bacillota bacterium]